MTLKADITNKVITDFGQESDKAFKMLENALAKNDDLNSDRLVRCIIFLAKGNINDLNKYIEAATIDPRDVMLWAEYETLNDQVNYKRMRDFDKTFEENVS